MKKNIFYSIVTVITISLTAFTACNQQSGSESDDNQVENNVSDHSGNLEELKAELKDVGTEIEQLTSEETASFKAEAEEVLTRFKTRINAFENQAEATGEEISASTRTAIDSLEQQAIRIESKLKVLGETTEEKAVEFREELKQDFTDLGESIRNFFKENA